MIINSAFLSYFCYILKQPLIHPGVLNTFFPTISPGFKYLIVWMFELKKKLAVLKAKNKYIYANSSAQLWYGKVKG